MAQGCLKCLKYTMCVVNLLCFISGTVVLGFGVYMMRFQMSSLIPSLANFNVANILLISGIIMTCISFLGFLGALKENRCFLLSFFLLLLILMLVELAAACLLLVYEGEINLVVERDLNQSLAELKTQGRNSSMLNDWDLLQNIFDCCGVHNVSDWGDKVPQSCCQKNPCPTQEPIYKTTGCLNNLRSWFEKNFLTTGISVIFICVIEVLGMCFAMTLFCHISRSGLGYKL